MSPCHNVVKDYVDKRSSLTRLLVSTKKKSLVNDDQQEGVVEVAFAAPEVFGLEAAEPVGAHVVRRTVVRIREEADIRALENPDGGGGRRDGGEERDGGDCRLGHDELAKKNAEF
jgi:hypothetical protein